MEEISPPAPGRHYELDWLRVIVTIDLIPFHAAWLITSVGGFSSVAKGTPFWNIIWIYVQFVSPLHMFLLCLVAGTATFMSLQRRSAGAYIVERIKRLFIPLIVYMVFLFAPLAYYWPGSAELRSHDYLTQVWPYILSNLHYMESTGGPGWAHMWFVAYLFLYSLLMLPFFLRFQRARGAFLSRIADILTGKRGALFLAGTPMFLTFALLAPKWNFFRNNLYSDWGYFSYNLAGFIIGFIICLEPRFMKAIKRHLKAAFVLGVLFSIVKIYMEIDMPSFATPAYNLKYTVYSFIAGFNTWFWVIAFIGIASSLLAFRNRFLGYFNRISYPFYIFHLTVMAVAGHFISRLNMRVSLEFILLCAISFLATLSCCELVKSNRITRFMLGIKGK